ncbi:MAG TPA: TetR family transcriptional regulator [Aestuariivirgaceae bacterium]
MFELIGESGIRGLTIARMAQHAGISKGIVHHYFRNKEELITAVVRHGNRVYSDGIRERLRLSKSPSERLWTIIYGQFSSEVFQAMHLQYYLQVLETAIQYQGILRTYNAVNARGRLNVAFALRSLVEPNEVKTTTHTIWNLLEGAWLLAAAEPNLTKDQLLTSVAAYLKGSVPRFDMSVVERMPPR